MKRKQVGYTEGIKIAHEQSILLLFACFQKLKVILAVLSYFCVLLRCGSLKSTKRIKNNNNNNKKNQPQTQIFTNPYGQ